MRVSRRAKRRFIVVALALGLAVCGVAGWRVVRKVQLRHLTAEARSAGMSASQEGDYAKALPELSYYLARNKGDLEALLAFAEARSRVPQVNNRHLIEAIGLYRATLQLDPRNPEALGRLLELYGATGRRPERLEIADRLLALDPHDKDALQAKSIALFQEGRFDDALADVERLIEIEPDSLVWRALFLEIIRAQSPSQERLVAICDEWIDVYEGDGRFYLLKAGVLITLGLTEEASAQGRLAAQYGADSLEVLGSMVDLLDQLQLQEEASALVEKARGQFADQRKVTEVIVRRLWQKRRIQEALAELDQYDTGELDVDLLQLKALLLIESQDVEGSDRALAGLEQQVQDADPKQRSETLAWTDAVRKTRDLDAASWLAAEEACRKAVSLQPQDPVLHDALGRTYAFVGEHMLAAESFERAAARDRHWVVPRLARVRSQLAAGRPQQALAGAVELLRLWPKATADAYLVLAAAWIATAPADRTAVTDAATGRPIDIVGLLESLYRQTDRDPRFAVILAEANLATGRREAAVDLIDEIRLQPDVPVATLLALADVSARGALGFESSLAERAREIAGPTPQIIAIQAEILRRQGRIEEGLTLIESVLALDGTAPSTLAARQTRATYLAMARHPDALKALAELLEEEPPSVEIATLVLAQQIAWEDRALIARAIERLGAVVGENAPRWCLARAGYVLQYEPDDPARLAEAMALVGGLLTRTPDSLPALMLMSSLLLADDDASDREVAIRHLRRAVDLYPGQLSIYPRLVALLQQQGDYDSAGEYLRRLRGQGQLPAQLLQVEIGLLAAQGDFDTAVVRLTAMVGESSSESAQLALAALHLRAGKYEEAEEIYTRMLAAPDRSVATIEATADFYANVGRSDEALALLDSAEIAAGPEARALILGRFHRKHGSLDEAGRWLQEAVNAGPDNAEAWTELVGYWLERGRAEEARQAAQAGLRLHPDNRVLEAAVAVGELARGDAFSSTDTTTLLQELGGEDEAVRESIALYGRATDDAGQLAPTERDLAAARDLLRDHPQFRPAWRLAVMMNSAAGHDDDAIRIARQAVGRFPGDPGPAEWAVSLLVRQGRLDDALNLAGTWRQRSLDDPLAADTIIASLLLDLGRPADAFDQLAAHAGRIYTERDRHPDRLSVWISALLLTKRFEAAAAIMRPLLSESEQWRATWLGLAANADPGITAQALDLAEPVGAAEPQDALDLAVHWLNLARRSGEPAHYQRAEELALLAGAQEELVVPALHVRSSIATALGDLPLAEALYRAVLASQPDDVLALNNLAFLLVGLGDRCGEAVELAARARALVPDDPSILDTCAQALACSGNLSDAEQAARLASSGRADDPDILLTLVGILIDRSNDVEAEVLLDRAEQMLRRMGRQDPDTWADVAAMRAALEQRKS